MDEMGFAPLDDIGIQLLFRLVAGASERPSLAIASHWHGESYRMEDAQHRKNRP